MKELKVKTLYYVSDYSYGPIYFVKVYEIVANTPNLLHEFEFNSNLVGFTNIEIVIYDWLSRKVGNAFIYKLIKL